jgi:predicted transcriptional regulator
MSRRRYWDEQGKTRAIYLSPDQDEALQRIAKEKNTTISDLVRQALRGDFKLPNHASVASIFYNHD